MKEKSARQIHFETVFYRAFDRLFICLPSKRIEKAYWKYREFVLYTFFGIGTFLVGLFVYVLFSEIFAWSVLIANVISWFFSTMFSFLTNRTWVFLQRQNGRFAFWVQMYGFFAGRFATLVIEEVLLFVLVDTMALPNVPVKLGSTVVVIILNYMLSKLFVFRQRGAAKGTDMLDKL